MTGTANPTATPLPQGRWRQCVSALVMAQFANGMQITLLHIGFPSIRNAFPDAVGSGWVMLAFLLASAVGATILSPLGDLFGRRRLLRILLLIAVTGALLGLLSRNLWMLVIATGLQGVCGAVLALCFGLARQYGPEDRIPSAVGIIISSGVVAGFAGMILGGTLVDALGWRAIFGASSLFFTLALGLVSLFVPADVVRQGEGETNFDWLAALLLTSGMASLVISLNQGASRGWLEFMTLLILGFSLICLTVWFARELKHDQPLIDVRLLFDREIALGIACMIFVALGTMQCGTIMSIYLQQSAESGAGFGFSAGITGMLLGLANLISLIAGPWAGRMVERHGSRSAMLVSAAIVVAAWVIVLLDSRSPIMVLASILINAYGLTATYVVASALIVSASPAERTSQASGLMVAARAITMLIGAQIILLLLAHHPATGEVGHDSIMSSHSGFQSTFVMVLAASLGCLACAWKLPRNGKIK